MTPRSDPSPDEAEELPDTSTDSRRRKLIKVWGEATGDRTRIIDYLVARGLQGDCLDGVLDDVLRLHPGLGYWDYDDQDHLVCIGDFPAMVARVTDVDGNGVTLHRTYLASDSPGKAPVPKPKKLMPAIADGATRGASIKLIPAGPVLCVGEGIETMLAVHAATGLPVWSAGSAVRLETVTLPLCVSVVHLWADNDQSGCGQQAAEKAAQRLHSEGRTVYVHIPRQPGTDYLDVYVKDGVQALLQELPAAPQWTPEVVPSSCQDQAVPLTDAIDFAELLDTLAVFLRRYIVFPIVEQLIALTLWVAHTFVFEQFDTSPYLAVTSPEKRCGKSRVYEVIELVVARPWRPVTPSPAAMYRKIERDQPTMLFDEVDAVFGAHGRQTSEKNEELRAILNAGNRRGATVDRCGGAGNRDLESFNVYTPKALAGIGDLPDTVSDRSIIIRMARKAPGESVGRFRPRKVAPAGQELRSRLGQWAASAELPEEPELPDELDDRAQDNWEVLLAIADAAGGEWPALAHRAALILSAGRTDLTESLGVRLLADIRSIFDADAIDKVWTFDLLPRLAEREESPWATLSNGQRITANRLASLLRPYGVRPHEVRIGVKTTKGYERGDFADAWTRYLPSVEGSAAAMQGQHPQHPCTSQENEGQQEALFASNVADDRRAVCSDVAFVASAGQGARDKVASESPPEVVEW